MKQLLLSATLILVLLGAGAQTTQTSQTTKKQTVKKEMKKGKEHVCTNSCTKDAHAYAHGEKGHKCTEECHKK